MSSERERLVRLMALNYGLDMQVFATEAPALLQEGDGDETWNELQARHNAEACRWQRAHGILTRADQERFLAERVNDHFRAIRTARQPTDKE